MIPQVVTGRAAQPPLKGKAAADYRQPGQSPLGSCHLRRDFPPLPSTETIALHCKTGMCRMISYPSPGETSPVTGSDSASRVWITNL